MRTKPPSFKLLVLGGVETGKTSIVTRYVCGKYQMDRIKTHTKLDIQTKHIYVDNEKYLLQLWDVAGQESFIGLTPTYYSSTSGIFIVVDITNNKSMNTAIKWKLDVDNKCITKPLCVLLANKWDIIDENCEQRCITDKQLDECCQKYNFLGWYSISASHNLNIRKSFDFLVSKVVKTKRELQKQNVTRQLNPYFTCCCVSIIRRKDIKKDINNTLLTVPIASAGSVNNRFREISFSSNKKSPFGDDYEYEYDSNRENTLNTFGIKDFEDSTNRICLITEIFKVYLIVIIFPIISVIQLFDYCIYRGYFTNKLDVNNKWDFIGTIINITGANNHLTNSQFNNIGKIFVFEPFDASHQLIKRFALTIGINYCLIIQFILLYNYIINMNNNKYFLLAFECIGPCILCLIYVLTTGIWYGYNTQLPELDGQMLYYIKLHFQYGTQTETASVLNFFLTLNQFNIHKVFKKDKYRNTLINGMLIIFAAQYAAIPTIFRFIYENNQIIPSKSLYFLWINSMILNFIYAFILLFICVYTSINAFRILFRWYFTLTNMLNYNQSIVIDIPFLPLESTDNITAWIELRGYLQYMGLKTFNNIEVWILLYIILMVFFIITSIVSSIHVDINGHTINYNCICIGSIYFSLLCIIHAILIHYLGVTFHSLHLKQLKECNRQRLVLNRQILMYKNKFDSLNSDSDRKIQAEIDSDDSIDDCKYDPFTDDQVDEKQLLTKINGMEKALQFLGFHIDFLKHHDFTPKFLGIIKLNRLIWISVLLGVLTAILTIIFTYYLKTSL